MASRPIQLPVHAKPARRLSKLRPRELYEQLRQNKEVRRIFRTYMKHGGHPDALFLLLWRCVCPPYRFRAKPVKRAVARLVTAIDEFVLAMSTYLEDLPPHALDARAIPLLEHLVPVKTELVVWSSAIPEDRATGFLGRPRGSLPSNFAAAVLAREFRKRFGQPRWEDIATLIEAVDASRFAKIHARSNLPSEAVRWSVGRILTKHKKAVNKAWIDLFGSTAGWPGPQFAQW